MSVEAPERIWAASVTDSYGEWQTVKDGLPRPVEYVRADKLEELAAALRIAQGNTDAAIEDYNEAKAALAEKDREIAALREVLEAMLEPYEDDPCRLDHHGYCQSHFLQEDCCVVEARAVLARNAGGKDAQ